MVAKKVKKGTNQTTAPIESKDSVGAVDANDKTDTRSRIIETAFELFGKYGFEGTSVRKISEHSNVNLAAINYHFQSKENLFWEVMVFTFNDVDNSIAEFATKSKDIYELSKKTFHYFIDEETSLKNTMKLILEESVGLPANPEIEAKFIEPDGPPGARIFAEFIQKEIKFPLSEEALHWGVSNIFGIITHWAMLLCSEHVCPQGKNDPIMNRAHLTKDLMLTVEASIDLINKHKNKFQKK